MADLSKLILITSSNTFKAENTPQTGSFVFGGSAPELGSSGAYVRSWNVNLSVAADYYDIMFNGPTITSYSYPNWTIKNDRWSAPAVAGYLTHVSNAQVNNNHAAFNVYTSISGNTLKITASLHLQYSAPNASLSHVTMNYRITPYSATTS